MTRLLKWVGQHMHWREHPQYCLHPIMRTVRGKYRRDGWTAYCSECGVLSLDFSQVELRR